jgi:hypothetical protein
MERSLARILEALQPAAERVDQAAAGPGSAAASAGGLLSLGVQQLAAAVAAHVPPDARRALEQDLGAYVALAGGLRAEMPELPAVVAAALRQRVSSEEGHYRRRVGRLCRENCRDGTSQMTSFLPLLQLMALGEAGEMRARPPRGTPEADEAEDAGGGEDGGEAKAAIRVGPLDQLGDLLGLLITIGC